MSYHFLQVDCSGVIGFQIIDFAADGRSAYQLAVSNGFVGTEAQWLASLQGAPGGGTYHQIIQTAVADGAMTVALVNALPGLQLYINGLAQTDFSYTSSLLTLPATLNIITDDVIKVTYFST